MSISTKFALKISSLIPDTEIPSPLLHPDRTFNPLSCTSSKSISDKPHKPLGFWYIRSHDREALSEVIMPYMAVRLPRRYLLQSLLEKSNWACEMLGVQITEMEGSSLTRLQNTTTYTYRMRFFRGSKTSLSIPDVQKVSAWETQQYKSELTGSEVYRLTCVPNKYGARFYRSSYRSAKQCAAWKGFCTRIQTFCDTVGLFASPEDPEQSLQELQNNLTSVCNTTAQLKRITSLAHSTARYIEKVEGDIASEILGHRGQIKDIRQHIMGVQLQCEKLRSAQVSSVKSQQRNSQLLTELQKQCTAREGELQYLNSRIVDNEARAQRDFAMLAEQMEERRTSSTNQDSPTTACSNVEVLVACRWLLEHLPDGPPVRQGFGNRWRLFWQSQWKEYKNVAIGHSHPLRSLIGDERYNKAGKGLYGTLSNFLHGYGRLRVNPLDPAVQKVLEAIGPVHYISDGQIDLELERARWVG